MGHEVDHGYSVRHWDRFMYFQMYVCNMFVLPTLTQRLLNKKDKKVTYRLVFSTPVTRGDLGRPASKLYCLRFSSESRIKLTTEISLIDEAQLNLKYNSEKSRVLCNPTKVGNKRPFNLLGRIFFFLPVRIQRCQLPQRSTLGQGTPTTCR